MKKIAVGDLGEFWYGDYKEPFEQLEGGVPGHPVGVVLKADDGKLLCAWCGKTYENLANHVNKTHKTSGREYKEAVGLLHKSALVSERLRMVHTSVAKRVGFGAHPSHRKDPSVVVRSRLRVVSGRQKPEFQNKTGTCYAQAVAVGQTVFRETGRLSAKTLRKHGIYESTVRRYFGDMEGYRRVVGAPLAHKHIWRQDEVRAALRRLADDLGRTPSHSDLRRYGLPETKVFARLFGSYVDACRAVGLDPNLPIVRDEQLDVRILVAYATTGRVEDVARAVHVDRAYVQAVFARYGAPFIVMTATGPDTTTRKAWAADMAKRLAGTEDQAA